MIWRYNEIHGSYLSTVLLKSDFININKTASFHHINAVFFIALYNLNDYL